MFVSESGFVRVLGLSFEVSRGMILKDFNIELF